MQLNYVTARIIRIASVILTLVFCLSACHFDNNDDVPVSAPLPSYSHKVAYIPLDNRPVNQERMRYLAQSANIELIMPDEELYRTALDNMPPNSDGSVMGNREKLLEWLLLVDAECDHFIISLDQTLSGGLVSSRWLCNDDLSLEYEIIDEISKLCESNTVYLFDTVMRLASTVGYQGYQYEEYSALRSYGAMERKTLVADELTLQNVIDSYPYSQNGEYIVTDCSTEMLTRYHLSRARKLKLTDYALRTFSDKADFFYIGVDDSSPHNTIQTNEINYINTLRSSNSVLGAATDEMALCCLSKMILELYRVDISIDVDYFGNGQNMPADAFDIGTLEESMNAHIDALGVHNDTEAKNVLNVLCLTRESDESDRASLLQRIKENQQKQIPSVLIDVSDHPEIFSQMLMEDSDVDICQILGYSSWNTASNAIGIALSQGAGRYAYLLSTAQSSDAANVGFLKAITFSYIKDISYKCFHSDLNGFLSDGYPCSANEVLDRLNNGRILVSITDYSLISHKKISVSNARYPWNRTFEVTFDIDFYENK